MLPKQTVVMPDVSVIVQRVDWARIGQGQRNVESELVPVGRAMALSFQRLTAAARNAGQSWHDWLCDQVIAGLWQERYRRPALACYYPDGPFLVYLCSPSESAQFAKVYARLNKIEHPYLNRVYHLAWGDQDTAEEYEADAATESDEAVETFENAFQLWLRDRER